MGTRTQGGWQLRLPPGKGRSVYVVRFRHNGQRIERSTGRSDKGEAAIEAARIYADVVSGRRVSRSVATDLSTAVASHLADLEQEVSPAWAKIVTDVHFGAHLLPFFVSFDHFTPAMYRTGLPKPGQPGTRGKNARKRKATIIAPADAKRILMAMPERSRRTNAFVRPLFTVLWETGLRPITILRLEAPLHYAKGAERLFITREIDKEGFERHVPLSPATRKALDRVCPESGKLFTAPKGSLRVYLRLALEAAGLADSGICVYDFKHTRISIGANSGAPLAGIAHLVGHTKVSTTALYVQSGEDAALAALGIMARAPRSRAFGGRSGGRNEKVGGGTVSDGSTKPRKTRGAKEGT